MGLRAIVLIGALVASSCATRLPLPRVCPDGAPLRLLQDPRCAYGICGYTCVPDRWRAKRKVCDR